MFFLSSQTKMFVICVVGWVTKSLMYNKFSYYFIRQVKYWWFRGDWYSLLLRELNYVFVAFDFTSRQTFCNLGRQIVVSPNYIMFVWRWNQKLQKHNLVVFSNYIMLISVIWSNDCLFSRRQLLISPNYNMLI